MRRLLPFLLALVLGVGSAALVACGDSGTKNGIPSANADRLSGDFEDVQQAVDSGRCSDLSGQLSQIERRLDQLTSASVDNRLVGRLREASQNLRAHAVDECSADKKPKTTTTDEPPVETQTQETVTTVEPETQTEPPPETVPPETVPQPGTTVPAEPTDPNNPPLDQDTLPEGGGAQPNVPPAVP